MQCEKLIMSKIKEAWSFKSGEYSQFLINKELMK